MLAVYLSMIDDEKDKSTFEIIYNEYKNIMINQAYAILENHEDAEDVVSETFIRIANNISSIDDPYSKKTFSYVMISVRNNAKSYLKSNSENGNLVYMDELNNMSDKSFLDKLDIEENYSAVVNAINSIGDTYRDVLYYHFVMEMKDSEICSLLGRKKATVKTQISRGKQILLEKLGKE